MRDKGQGGLTKRTDGRWQGTYQDAQGRKRYVYGPTKRKAQEALAEAINAVRLGTSVEPGRVTVEQFMKRWLRDVKAHDTERSTHAFYTDKAAYIIEALGKLQLRHLTAPQVQQLYSGLLERGLSPTTVRSTATTLKAMLTQAHRWNLVGRNVAADAKPPKARRFQPTVLTEAEVRQLLAANTDHRMYPAVALIATTGVRVGELRGLQWDTVDFGRQELTVRQNLDDLPGGGWVLKSPKSERGHRTIALGATAINALYRQRGQQLTERLKAGPKWADQGFVFTTLVGTPLHESKVLKQLHQMEARAGVPQTRVHDLRHTHATILLLHGVPVHVVAARLGDDPATVLRSYAHLLPTSQREAADKFEALLG